MGVWSGTFLTLPEPLSVSRDEQGFGSDWSFFKQVEVENPEFSLIVFALEATMDETLPSLTWGTGSLIRSATGKMYEKTPTENVTLVVEHWNHHIVTEHINYASLNSFELYTSWAIASNKLLGFPQDLWLSKRGSRLQKWPQKIWVVKVLVRWKLTCPPEHVGWKMYSLKCSLFRGHICFAGCMSMILVQKGCNLDFLLASW